ncbi:myotubularin-related protein 9 [Phlebotomus argentipes]|uniref:myotubularin-related protein 9 n=1 Tax=Phlebotomus argentipes TaxID=94469 RepID=UPI002892EDF5|nr:myotubularin-related protein 9 [Phlebotomus argentipes]
MEFAELILTPKLDNVVLLAGGDQPPVAGTLCITGHHLILSTRKEDTQELWLLHQNIDFLERKPHVVNNQLQGGTLVLKCKDLRVIALEISASQDFLNVAQTIEQLITLDSVNLLYAFFYRPMFSILEDGYEMFRPEVEFSKLLASEEWRLSSVNRDFSVCSSYPAAVVVPRGITDEQIIASAGFRDGGRFPLISYRHENGAVMLRSAQPSPTSSGKRCRADEAILNSVLGKSRKGFIVDTWGVKGKATTETDQHYSQWKKATRSVGTFSHISQLLECFSRLVEACNDITCSPDKWLSRLENSNWLGHVLSALNTACVVAQCLDQDGSPVLVHGGKGLDTTLIVTSLVQIILNPDCRTVRGLQALIEREWVQAGFPFHTRHRQSCYTPSHVRAKTSGSSFVLFLDCVHQLHAQFTCSFEFSTNFLVMLFEHSYSSQFGTFLADSERERTQLGVTTKTTSLWSYLNRPEVLRNFLSPVYEPNPAVIWPSVAPISLVVWKELYLRWVVDQDQAQKLRNQIQSLVDEEKELRSKVVRLRKQLMDLYRDYQDLEKCGRGTDHCE